jgi:hypothetical protein
MNSSPLVSANPRIVSLRSSPAVLQLLPRAPGTFDGVGDYALALARGLRDQHGIDSVFVAHETEAKNEIESFRIFPLQEFSRARVANETCNGLILHYVNYGFQKRGVPVTLVSLLKSLRYECGGASLVVFHELFASGPPWRSEFWLQPLQKKIARDLARLADTRVVSCESSRDQLEKLSPGSNAIVQPVTSTWGEPVLNEAQLRERDPQCWIICGGTALVERSLRSFLEMSASFAIAPRKLFVIGGARNLHVRALLNAPSKFNAEHFPAIYPADAAAIFQEAAFGWMDYFDSNDVPADVLLKSSTFNALCAHGVVTLMPSVTGKISIKDDVLSAPFPASKLPTEVERADAAVSTYQWYHRHAASDVLTKMIAQQLRLA